MRKPLLPMNMAQCFLGPLKSQMAFAYPDLTPQKRAAQISFDRTPETNHTKGYPYMKSDNLTRFFTLLRLLLVCLVLSSVTPVWAADYDSLVSQARKQLENEQFAEALATAKAAVSKKPKDYKGHYYAAMAHMSLGQFDEADAEVTTALSQAPKSAKPAVEKLVSAIKDGRKGADMGIAKKKEAVNSEDKKVDKDIFLECSGIKNTSIFHSQHVTEKDKQEKFVLVLKINNDTISVWTSTSFAKTCSKKEKSKSVACFIDDESFYSRDIFESRDSDSKSVLTRTIKIDRRSGLFEFRDSYRVDYDDGSSRSKTDVVKDGACVPCSEPTPPKAVPNKF
jgi:tetratricopeptide (TPR) repeat protein